MRSVEVTNVITGAKCNKGHNTVIREQWFIIGSHNCVIGMGVRHKSNEGRICEGMSHKCGRATLMLVKSVLRVQLFIL